MTSSQKFPVSFWKNPYPNKRKLLPQSRTSPRGKWFPQGGNLGNLFPILYTIPRDARLYTGNVSITQSSECLVHQETLHLQGVSKEFPDMFPHTYKSFLEIGVGVVHT